MIGLWQGFRAINRLLVRRIGTLGAIAVIVLATAAVVGMAVAWPRTVLPMAILACTGFAALLAPPYGLGPGSRR
jgi:hypothetical protein